MKVPGKGNKNPLKKKKDRWGDGPQKHKHKSCPKEWDLDNDLTSKVWKIADNTKITSKVITTQEKEALQADLDQLTCWTSKWGGGGGVVACWCGVPEVRRSSPRPCHVFKSWSLSVEGVKSGWRDHISCENLHRRVAEYNPHAVLQVPPDSVCIEDRTAAWASHHGATINKIKKITVSLDDGDGVCGVCYVSVLSKDH